MQSRGEVDPLIGQAIGRYIIRSRLAQGGMGAVYVAEHERLRTRKVLKVLLPEYSRNEIVRQRFEREATAASRLKHRNIVTIDDFGILPDGQLFLMMPFLDGRPLDAHIAQNGTLTLHHTFHIVVQLCRALQHLHDHGIVHRDLKPGNAFIVQSDDNPYEVILIDLGIARDVAEEATSKKTQTGMAMGTPGYMAVEQYGNAAGATPSADVYALAIITWEMLTGQTPWGMHDPRVLYHLQMTERPEPPAGHVVPENVIGLLRQALAVDPAERPPSARAFAVALASMIPAMPPHVPSGAEIMARFAKELVQHAGPELETVRNSSKGEHASPLAWPYRSTQVPNLPQEVPVALASDATPVQPPTVSERPGAPAVPVASPSTTLGASSGVVVPIAPPATGTRLRIALGLMTAAIAGGVVFGVIALRSRSSSTNASSPADAASVMPAAPVSSSSNSSPADATADGVVDAGVPDAPPDASVTTPSVDGGSTTPSRPKPDIRRPPAPRNGSARGAKRTTPIDPDAVEE